MKAEEVRKKFLNYFEKRGHAIIPSSSLVPENDPSVLFTTAGMHPLVPYLLGEKHPLGKRLTDVQKCVRTGDIDEVGDYSHHTFFEMLGNWSLGDYFKEDAIKWSYEFLTSKDYLGLDKNRIAVSVFKGDESAPFDEESFNIWKGLGIDEKRIAKLPKKNNWWGPAGETGPCGPDSEMFYWVGDPDNVPESFNDDSPLWLEIWNDVFMEFNKKADGTFEKLSQRNVDTGMGLERILAVINGLDDDYRTELFWPIIQKVESISGKKYEDEQKNMRIIADHLKASVFVLGDEKRMVPSNTAQGYVLRRLIRRAVRCGEQLGIKLFTPEVASVVVDMYKDIYPELLKNRDFILGELTKEEEKFQKTLEHGLKEFEKGVDPFILFSTYGFPIELTLELAKEKGIHVDVEDFNKKMLEHQKLSQTSSAGMFKGGLADTSEKTTMLHTSTHLMLAGLRKYLGNDVHQAGSNITVERTRFDFNYGEKVDKEILDKVEDYVNEAISKKCEVTIVPTPKEEARASGVEGSFWEKYPEVVNVYTVTAPDGTIYSRELCGGPHVKNTGDIKGKFKIIKEESSSAGIRRIKAVLE